MTTLPCEGLYFSDLTDDQLMALFCKGPLLRFQICAINVSCKRSGTRNKLYGFIRLFEQAGDLVSQYAFNHDYNDSVVIPQNPVFLDGICCSIPACNNAEIHAKLYVTTDKDFRKFSSDDDDDVDDYSNEVKDKDITKMDDVEKSDDYRHYEMPKFVYSPEDVAFYNGFIEMLETTDDHFPEKEIDINDNEPFEFCDDSLVVNLSDGASFGNDILQGQGGFIRLYYVAFKYAVDATVEAEFVADNKETKVDGIVKAMYGNNFDYGSQSHYEKQLYKVKLFLIKYRDSGRFLMPGKINLTNSTLAVPAQFSLIIYASFKDITSGDVILTGSYEFHVPRDGGTSCASIAGIDCSLKLRVDWKLPPLDIC